MFFQLNYSLSLDNDIIYLFSDGFVDQDGGPNRKTFKSKE